MKRFILLALVLCIFLSGCNISDVVSTSNDTSSTAEEILTTPEELPATEPENHKSILDSRQSLDDTGALWYLPNAQIEAQEYPMLYAFGGELLVTTNRYIRDGESELMLTLLSAATGETLQSSKIVFSGNAVTQILDGAIAVCDSNQGLVIVLDAKLQEIVRYTHAPDGEQWFLGCDLDTLYQCSYLNGIRAVSLSTGKERFFVNISELSVCGISDTGICFTGVNMETQRYGAFCLDLANGTLVEPPFSGDFTNIQRSGEIWLACFYQEESTFAFGADSNARVVTVQNGTLSLLDPIGHILFTSLDGELRLYDSAGAFLSSCTLSGWYMQGFAWQEELNGYLMMVNNGEGSSRLLFWNIGADTNGEDLETQLLADMNAAPGGETADAALYQRAQALGERFGVEIRIADQCDTEFSYFRGYQVADYAPISAGLDLLEHALSVFPAGFFQQLRYGHVGSLQFQLIGGLTATNGFGGEVSYNGFTAVNGNVCCIVLDLYSLSTNIIWHELSHAIDRRLAWDAMYRENALFSEESWSAHNPKGFVYSEEYGSTRNDITLELYTYFVDAYAMINATEDRARIFEFAVENSGTLYQDAGLRAKLQYYSQCIRDCFDTTDWPETTAWEAPLR